MSISRSIAQPLSQPIVKSLTGKLLWQSIKQSLFGTGSEGGLYPIGDLKRQGKLYTDSAGTTVASAVDDPVGRVDDLSGNGNHMTQSTATARPLLKQDANGNWYLQFDGVDDFLSAPFSWSSSPLFCSVAMKTENADDSSGRYLLDIQSGRTILAPSEGAAGAGIGYYDGTWKYVDIQVDAPTVASWVLQSSGGVVRWKGQQILSESFTEAPVGGDVVIGARVGTTGAFLQMRLYGMVVSNAIPSTPEVQRVEKWLNQPMDVL